MQRNMLFVLIDQQRWDAMGSGGGRVRTPSIDRIAGEGFRFRNTVDRHTADRAQENMA